MVTRAKASIFKPPECMNCHVTTTLPLPRSHVHALRNHNWKEAMLDEYNALNTNETWVLVPRPANVCLYMHDPHEPHLAALKWILWYVCSTLNHGIQLHVYTTTQLTTYTDADWAGCPITHRSTFGYCVFLEDNILSWSTKRQVTLSRSNAEDKYQEVANVVAKTAWINSLLHELPTPLFTTTLVYCDNDQHPNLLEFEESKNMVESQIEREGAQRVELEGTGMGLREGPSEPAQSAQATPSSAFIKENINVIRTMIKEHDHQTKAKVTMKKLVYNDSKEEGSDSSEAKGLSERFSNESSRTRSERLGNKNKSKAKTKEGRTKSEGRRMNKVLQAFMDKFKSKSSHIKGVPPVLCISAFVYGHGHPELAKKLNDKIIKTMDEMFERVRTFIRGEASAGSAEIKYVVALGKLANLVKDICQGNQRSRGQGYGNVKVINMVGLEGNRKRPYKIEGPRLMEEIAFLVQRIYVDEGSSSKIMYEHCFKRFDVGTKSKLRKSNAPLVRFSELRTYHISYIQKKEVEGQKFFRQGEQVLQTLDKSNEGTSKAKKEPQEELTPMPRACRSYVGIKSKKEGSEVGLILVDPKGNECSHAIRLNFCASEDNTDYEALLARLVAFWEEKQQTRPTKLKMYSRKAKCKLPTPTAIDRNLKEAKLEQVLRLPWVRGHNTNDCYHIKKQIKDVVASGKLARLVKGIRQGNQRSRGQGCGNVKVINMVGLEGNRKRPYKIEGPRMMEEIAFLVIPQNSLANAPIILEGTVEGFWVRRIYVDEGSSSKIMYEHCFKSFDAGTKSKLRKSNTSLVGFSEASGDYLKEHGRVRLDIDEVEKFQSYLHRVMDKVFMKQKGQNVEVYLEEVVIKSKSEQDQVEDVKEILYKLQRINMKPDPSEYAFRMEEGNFLELKTYDISYIQKKGAEGQIVKKFFGQGEQVLQSSDKSNEATSNAKKEPQEELTPMPRAWRSYVVIKSNKEGSEMGLILVDPKAKECSHAI
nr:ribonuclease H-like domain-containing protein [Tanacetum cinerariifolium]